MNWLLVFEAGAADCRMQWGCRLSDSPLQTYFVPIVPIAPVDYWIGKPDLLSHPPKRETYSLCCAGYGVVHYVEAGELARRKASLT